MQGLKYLVFVFALVAALCQSAPTCCAQNGSAESGGPQNDPQQSTGSTFGESSTQEATESNSLFQIIFSGGWTGLLIVLLLVVLSMAAMALAVEHAMTIRAAVLMPPDLAAQVRTQLASGNLAAADQACQAKPSFLAFVLRAGMAEVEGGWSAVEKGLEDATAEQAARLFRKIEYLSVIGNIAPMIGLLGTVTGMIFAFQEVADTQGAARAAELAEGIYTALVTTVGGLIVAIPSLAGYAIFRNRVDQLVAECAYAALHAASPLKRMRVTRTASSGPPPVEGRRK